MPFPRHPAEHGADEWGGCENGARTGSADFSLREQIKSKAQSVACRATREEDKTGR